MSVAHVNEPTTAAAFAERYVTCQVAGETYAVPALAVREVVRWMPVTRVPNSARAVNGVINLRGEIVPVIDLRVHLGLAAAEPTDRSCIIVLSMPASGGKLQAGLIVDLALEVTRIPARDISAGGDIAPGHAGRYIAGIAQTKGGLLILLDGEAVMVDALSADEGGAGR